MVSQSEPYTNNETSSKTLYISSTHSFKTMCGPSFVLYVNYKLIVTLSGKRSFVSRISPGGQSSFHVQTTLLVFECCAATGALLCIFLELLQQLAELHSTAGVPLTPTDGILHSGHTLADSQLQNDDSCK